MLKVRDICWQEILRLRKVNFGGLKKGCARSCLPEDARYLSTRDTAALQERSLFFSKENGRFL